MSATVPARARASVPVAAVPPRLAGRPAANGQVVRRAYCGVAPRGRVGRRAAPRNKNFYSAKSRLTAHGSRMCAHGHGETEPARAPPPRRPPRTHHHHHCSKQKKCNTSRENAPCRAPCPVPTKKKASRIVSCCCGARSGSGDNGDDMPQRGECTLHTLDIHLA